MGKAVTEKQILSSITIICRWIGQAAGREPRAAGVFSTARSQLSRGLVSPRRNLSSCAPRPRKGGKAGLRCRVYKGNPPCAGRESDPLPVLPQRRRLTGQAAGQAIFSQTGGHTRSRSARRSSRWRSDQKCAEKMVRRGKTRNRRLPGQLDTRVSSFADGAAKAQSIRTTDAVLQTSYAHAMSIRSSSIASET